MNATALPLDQDPPDGDVLAGEYVLGVLDAGQRRAVEQRMLSEPAFAAEVTRWETDFMALALQIPPATVADYVWARIGSELGFDLRPGTALPPRSTSFWDNVALWRWLGVGGLATAAVCVLALLNVLRAPEPPTSVAVVPAVVEPVPMASTLTREDGKPGFVATVDKRSGRMTITPLDPIVEQGRVQELWLIPADGTPRSLGLVSAQAPQSGRVPEQWLALLDTRAILAITLEPPGGGPGGKPTGPVTAKGPMALL
ncbi:MAG: anti-sigma factor [Pseudoxanthomonas sp.]